MLRNPNHPPSAVFAPRPDGSFTRFNALTGAPMPASAADAHGLHDRDGKLHFGEMPPYEALDAAPSLFDRGASDPRPPARDQGPGGMLHPHQLQAARDLHDFAKDRLSPDDHRQFADLLLAYLHHLAGGAAGEGEDQPLGGGMEISETHENPHQRPHSMTTDSARALRDREAFAKDWPQIAAIGRDTYGLPCPMRPKLPVHDQRLALDARERAGGGSLAEESDPTLRDAIAGAHRIGRAY